MFIRRINRLNPHQILLPASWKPRLQNIAQPYVFHFGLWQQKVTIELDDRLPENTIGLPARVFWQFTIPEKQVFELYMDQDQIHLGPVIAVMAADRKIARRELKKYQEYLAHLRDFKGLICLFAAGGIDPAHHAIRGYAYLPDRATRGEFPWLEGRFPYPGAVYRRIGFPGSRKYDDLAGLLGHRVFNSVHLDKWTVRKALSPDPLVGVHLPDTVLLTHLQALDQMLDKHGSVYLKPVRGSLGLGIKRVDRAGEGYRIIHRSGTRSLITSKNKMKTLLKRLKASGPYLIQQSVAFSHLNRQIDFRVIMQKDANQKWECSGIVARFGREGRVYTNDISRTSLAKGVLTGIYQMDDEMAEHKVQEMISVCKIACHALERSCGNCGDLGFDVAVDPQHRVWLLEMNFRQQPEIAVLKEDPAMFGRVISRPFEYARALAGFPREKAAREMESAAKSNLRAEGQAPIRDKRADE